MSTIDTSTWNPDADLNTAIEGIPLNSDAGIAQTWQAIRILMAAFKGDTGSLAALLNAFQTALASKAADSGVVHIAGTETVTGLKTFSTSILMSDGEIQRTDATHNMTLRGGTGGNTGAAISLMGGSASSNAGAFIFAPRTTSAQKTMIGYPDGTLTWNGQAMQLTSDERLKTPLSSVPDDVLDAWEAVGWGQFQFLASVAEKGNSARLHLGLIAQRVKAVFEERGLDACVYGVLCHEERESTGELPAVDLWMVRYEEALAMEAACQRRRADRLEARVVALEEKINGR